MTEPAILHYWAPGDGGWYVGQLADPEIQRFTTEQVTTTADEFRAALRELSRRTEDPVPTHQGLAPARRTERSRRAVILAIFDVPT
jgi:hypothetical protein